MAYINNDDAPGVPPTHAPRTTPTPTTPTDTPPGEGPIAIEEPTEPGDADGQTV